MYIVSINCTMQTGYFLVETTHIFVLNTELTVKERLEKVFNHFSITQTELAKQIDIHPSQISILGTPRRPDISKGIAGKISKRLLGLNPWWLLTGEGEMLLPKASEKKSEDRVEEGSLGYGGGALAALREKVLDHEETIRLLREILAKHEETIRLLQAEVAEMKKRL